jgi:hypothetical protein
MSPPMYPPEWSGFSRNRQSASTLDPSVASSNFDGFDRISLMVPQFRRAALPVGVQVDPPTALRRHELSLGMSALSTSSSREFGGVGVGSSIGSAH